MPRPARRRFRPSHFSAPRFSPSRFSPRAALRALAGSAVLAAAGTASAAPPAAGDILGAYEPKVVGGAGVSIETPPREQWDQCEVTAISGPDSGWQVAGPQGQLLRRVVDADGDQTIELFSYYDQGMEVYREWDSAVVNGGRSDAEVTADNFRWVNFGGTKWGVDLDGDQKVDRWNRISASEAGTVAAQAVIDGDAALLETVVATPAELTAMGVDPQLVEEVAESLRDVPGQLAEMREGSAMIGSRPTFQSVNVGQPGLILPGPTARRELEVFENTNALLNVPGGQMGIVTLSEMVRVGDRIENGRLVEAGRVWKLTALPRPVEGNGQIVLGGPLIQPPDGIAVGGGANPGVSPKVAQLLKELGALKRPAANANAAQQKAFAAKLLPLYRELFEADETEERHFWLTQQADTYHGLFVSGAMGAAWCQKQLENLRGVAENEAEEALPAIDQKSLFIEYTERREAMMANAVNNNPPPAAAAAFQKWWTDAREQFVRDYPEAPESAGFLLELAMDAEQDNRADAAAGSYRRLAQQFPNLQIGKKAVGALRRLGLEGKPLEFRIPLRKGGALTQDDARGKVVLLTFWNVNCEPCRQNLPILKDLHDRFGSRGLEIVALNIDETPNPIAGYVEKYGVPFSVGYEPGGFDGPTATQYGIVDLPTMILTDRAGRVVGTDLSAREVQSKVEDLLK